MKREQRIFRKLQSIARDMGGQLWTVGEDEWKLRRDLKNSFVAPFDGSLMLELETLTVFLRLDDEQHVTLKNLTGIIHEMGHAFAVDEDPNHADEFEFIGWEWALARKVGITFKEWCENNDEYAITEDGETIGDFLDGSVRIIRERHQSSVGLASKNLKDEVKYIIRTQVELGRKMGIIDKWTPLSVSNPKD